MAQQQATVTESKDLLISRVNSIPWYHTIDLGNGIITPGVDNTPERLRHIQMPENLAGKSVLDIGAWDGFFSFEAERRGAARVLATDYFCWTEQVGRKAGFDLAKRVLKSRVEELQIDLLEMSPDRIGVFDLVLFLGVLYHMRHPLLALEKVASVTSSHLILDTELDLMGYRRPAMAFYPERELGNDPTNWWGPNPAAVIALLRSVGFAEIKIVYPSWVRTSLPWRVASAFKRRLLQQAPFLTGIGRGRMTFHAWR